MQGKINKIIGIQCMLYVVSLTRLSLSHSKDVQTMVLSRYIHGVFLFFSASLWEKHNTPVSKYC